MHYYYGWTLSNSYVWFNFTKTTYAFSWLNSFDFGEKIKHIYYGQSKTTSKILFHKFSTCRYLCLVGISSLADIPYDVASVWIDKPLARGSFENDFEYLKKIFQLQNLTTIRVFIFLLFVKEVKTVIVTIYYFECNCQKRMK